MPVSTERVIADVALGLLPDVGIHVWTSGPVGLHKPFSIFVEMLGERLDGSGKEITHLNLPRELTSDERIQWHEYSFDLYGVIVPYLPEACPWPFWRLPSLNGQERSLQLWRQWARYRDSPLYAERLWIPDVGEKHSIQGVKPPVDQDALMRANRGMELLYQLEKARKHGPKKETRKEARDRLRQAKAEVQRERSSLTRGNLAAAMCIAPSSVDKVLQRAGWRMEDLKTIQV